jgi:hypothetical protein
LNDRHQECQQQSQGLLFGEKTGDDSDYRGKQQRTYAASSRDGAEVEVAISLERVR